MLLTTELYIPPNTDKTEPVTIDMLLPPGIISHVSVLFPPGVHCEAGIAATIDEVRVFPINREGWLTGDGETVEFEEQFDITNTTRRITFHGYNEDAYYSHTLYIRLIVEPLKSSITPEDILEWLR